MSIYTHLILINGQKTHKINTNRRRLAAVRTYLVPFLRPAAPDEAALVLSVTLRIR